MYLSKQRNQGLRVATASEPLTLPEEYAMQTSWRTDADKLTFIACCNAPAAVAASSLPSTSASSSPLHITAGREDAPRLMVGDVNLFLNPDDEEEAEDNDQIIDRPNPVIGEVEIMIASKEHQGKGLGRETLLTFLWYILTSLDAIMLEYHSAHGKGKTTSEMKYLRVKIDKDNTRSIKLFESAGFTKVNETPNYFGELELRWSMLPSSRKEMESKMDAVPKLLEYKS